jgi:hypothetical protein
MDLPKLEEGGPQPMQSGIPNVKRSLPPKIDDILPKQEYRMLNPNIQIYSEELAK